MSQSAWIGIIIVIIIIVGAFLWINMAQAPVDTGANSPATGNEDTNTAPAEASVSYDGTKFTPSSVTIRKGGKVTWMNDSSGNMWVASAQHPTHTIYDGTSRTEHCPNSSGAAFDQCAGSTSNYTFQFDKAGTWNYHDHINASAFGSVTVVE